MANSKIRAQTNQKNTGLNRKLPLTSKPLLIGVALVAIILSSYVYSSFAATTLTSLWSNTVVPKNTSSTDNQNVELGLKFKASGDGFVEGIKFFKGTGNGGVHTGSIWTSTGQRLATVVFANETASGWQMSSFNTPVKITAGKLYVISYSAQQGHYAYSSSYFATKSRTNGNLTAPGGAGVSNGVYKYGGGFPADTYRATNYWVDLTYAATATVAATPVPTPSPIPTPKQTPAIPPAPTSTPVATPAPLSANFCSTYPALPRIKPDASNTGVPAGTVLRSGGDITVTTPNTTIDAMNLSGGIIVAANNTTIKNSKIMSGGYYAIKINDGATGTTIINNEIYTNGGGYIGISGANAIACGNYIHGWENGMTVGGGMIIQANYIEKLLSDQVGAHYDGIEVYDGGNSKIWGNNIRMTDKNGAWLNETGAINLTAWHVPIDNVEMNGNWLGGGS